VFGVEGDGGGGNIKGSRSCANFTNITVAGAFTSGMFDCTSKMDWIATATARVGYAYERTLFYAKAGGAWTNESVTAGCIISPALNVVGAQHCNNAAGVLSNGFSTSGNRSGWTIGYGTEFDLGHNWSAKAEYDYIDFGRKTLVATDTTLISDHPTTSQVKIGVNYRFSGPAAVVAKY
jgi:opacity protein-like surface antigen